MFEFVSISVKLFILYPRINVAFNKDIAEFLFDYLFVFLYCIVLMFLLNTFILVGINDFRNGISKTLRSTNSWSPDPSTHTKIRVCMANIFPPLIFTCLRSFSKLWES